MYDSKEKHLEGFEARLLDLLPDEQCQHVLQVEELMELSNQLTDHRARIEASERVVGDHEARLQSSREMHQATADAVVARMDGVSERLSKVEVRLDEVAPAEA